METTQGSIVQAVPVTELLLGKTADGRPRGSSAWPPGLCGLVGGTGEALRPEAARAMDRQGRESYPQVAGWAAEICVGHRLLLDMSVAGERLWGAAEESLGLPGADTLL